MMMSRLPLPTSLKAFPVQDTALPTKPWGFSIGFSSYTLAKMEDLWMMNL
jgi:hypothetical protein